MATMASMAAIVATVAACGSTPTGQAPPSTGQPSRIETVGDLALGVNVAAWDGVYRGPTATATAIDAGLRAAGVGLLRYPGGSWADEYDWSTNTDTSTCAPTAAATTACSSPDPLGFDTFSSQARGLGASALVTVNYGSGTPALAASWVAHATATRAGVAWWEVGNESYSCYETNTHLAEPPTDVQGYRPDSSVCPSTALMAKSYAAHAPPYLQAMRKADPAAVLGVPWAFTSSEASGAAVADAAMWDRVVLRATGPDIGFVDAHWYPFDQIAGLSDQAILASVHRIPAAAARIRASLRAHAPRAAFVVGETNISERLTTLDFAPVSALFAAATTLEWLAQGAGSVVWWDLNNYGSPAGGDYGLVSSGSPEVQAPGTPFPPYYGVQLASMLTTTGSRLSTLATGSASVVGFRSDQHGHRNLLLVNSGGADTVTVLPSWFRRGSAVATAFYSAATAGGADPIVHATVTAGHRLSLPAESIVVLSGTP